MEPEPVDILDIPPHEGGKPLVEGWTREEVFDEMIGDLKLDLDLEESS